MGFEVAHVQAERQVHEGHQADADPEADQRLQLEIADLSLARERTLVLKVSWVVGGKLRDLGLADVVARPLHGVLQRLEADQPGVEGHQRFLGGQVHVRLGDSGHSGEGAFHPPHAGCAGHPFDRKGGAAAGLLFRGRVHACILPLGGMENPTDPDRVSFRAPRALVWM